MEPTRGACFQYGAQACRLSFPSSFVPSGTRVRDFALVAFSYPSGRCPVDRGGAGPLPLSTVTSPFPLSFHYGFPFPPSFVPNSFFSFLPDLALAAVASRDILGECLVLFSKSRCEGSGHLLPVRFGHKACSRSFLRW